MIKNNPLRNTYPYVTLIEGVTLYILLVEGFNPLRFVSRGWTLYGLLILAIIIKKIAKVIRHPASI